MSVNGKMSLERVENKLINWLCFNAKFLFRCRVASEA